MNYVVILDSPNSMNTKTVKIYLENNGETRQIQRENIAISINVDDYIANNFSVLWNAASPLASDIWDSAFEHSLRDVYRSIVQAGVNAAKVQGATLTNVIDAMEAAIDSSGKAASYSKLKTMASTATAAQRDNLFVIASFLILNNLLSD